MAIFLLFLSVFCASIPMLFFLAVVWWLDRYDREPIWLVALVFLWGAIGAIAGAVITGLPSIFILNMTLGSHAAQIISPVIIAPLTEEITKAFVLFFVVRSVHFDNVTDGFVYGAAAGLGFGMTENFMYFAGSVGEGVVTWLQVVMVRTLFSAVMHAAATATVGAAIGYARYRKLPLQLFIITVGFALAMGMHALWNGLIVISVEFEQPILNIANFGVLLLEVLVVVTVFLLSVHSEKRLIRLHLTQEAREGLLPAAHAGILTSMVKRSKKGWLEAGIPQDDYVTTVTRLAFRLEHARVAPKRKRLEILKDVQEIRAEVTRLRSMARYPASPASYQTEIIRDDVSPSWSRART